MGPVVGLVGLGLGLVGTAGQVISGIGAAESAARQQEGLATFQEAEARAIEDAAAAEEEANRRKTARALGKLRAQSAAVGLDPGTGSLLLLDLDSAKEAELEALTIRQRGAVAAFGKRTGAQLARQQAAIERGRKGGIIAGGIFRGGSLLAGFAGAGGFGGFGGGGTSSALTTPVGVGAGLRP